MNRNKKTRVVIVGAGSDLSLVAYALAKGLEVSQAAIVAVDVGGNTDEGLVSTFSDMRAFNEALGVSERDFMAGVDATVSFGCKLPPLGSAKGLMLTDSPYGLTMHNTLFHQLFSIYSRARPYASLDDFCLSARLAQEGKFAPKSDKAKSVYSMVSYGYAFDSSACGRYFKRLALARNVTYVSSSEVSAAVSSGRIEKLTTSSGQTLAADLFIDCTPDRALYSQVQKKCSEYDLISATLPHWRFALEQEEDGSPVTLYSEMTVTETGFERSIRHRGRRCKALFEFDKQQRGGGSGGAGRTEAQSALASPWVDNCVALGSASAIMPGLLLERYHLLQGQLLQLLELWSGGEPSAASAEIFNTSCRQSVNHLLDLVNIFLAAHPGFADQVRLTEANRSRVKLFTSSGALFATDNAVVPDQQWPALLTGLGFKQSGGNFQAIGLNSEQVVEQLDSLESLLQKATDAAPAYDEWLKRTGTKHD